MKKCICLFIISALMLSPFKAVQAQQINTTEVTTDLNTSTTSEVATDSNTSIPPEVIEKAYSKVHKTPTPKVKAYETNQRNEWVSVPTISDINSSINSRSVPYDPPYTYTFNSYDPDYVKRNWNYDVVSVFRCVNNYTTSVTATYVLETSKTTNASVSLSISGKTEVKAAFLAKLEVTAGFVGSFSKTWQKGWSASTKTTVKPKTVAYLTNYQVGVNSNGSVVYDKRTPTGAICGQYRETAGGTVISESDINIEVTSTEPIK